MSLWRMAWSYLWDRKVTTCLTIFSVSLGVALISTVLTLRDETQKRFEEEKQAYDIVVGHKGSRLQLVLSCMYFMDVPTGNIPYSIYEELLAHEEVEAAFPIGLGDTYKGFRLVGTTPDIFDYEWVSSVTGETRRPYTIAEGRRFEKPLEAVVGGMVARQTGLQIGSTFEGTHGLVDMPGILTPESHKENPYTVVGVLELSGTSADRAIFVDLESVWNLHEHEYETEDQEGGEPEKQVTAVLIQLVTPGFRFEFAQIIDDHYNVMSAIPMNQIKALYDQFLATAKTVLLSVGYLVVVVSAISVLIGLYLSIIQRKRDLAIMRALGASAYEIFGAVLIEAFLVTALGVVSGCVLGKAATWGIGQYMAAVYGFTINPWFLGSEELGAFAVVSLVGIVAGIVPAWQAYQTDVARDLAEL